MKKCEEKSALKNEKTDRKAKQGFQSSNRLTWKRGGGIAQKSTDSVMYVREKDTKQGLRANSNHSLPLLALRPCLVIAAAILSILANLSFNYNKEIAAAASITLSVPASTLALDINPDNTFQQSSPSSVTVKTSSPVGYTLKIKAKTDNKLKNSNAELPSISAKLSQAQYQAAGNSNTWGYKPSKFNSQDNTDFLPGPTTQESIIDTTKRSNDVANTYNIVLGAKVSLAAISGSYKNTFQFIALANEPTYMQDWSGCSSLEEHQIVDLVDKRDNNVYQVSKLKDGKCWMLENLRLGDENLTNRTITSADSNVTISYTIPASNLSNFTVGSSGFGSNPNNQAAYVDATYGGYYTWQTATAGTGSSYASDGQNAPSSICPKSWRLPTGGSSGEFKTLNDAYGGVGNTDAHLITTPIPGFLRAGFIYYANSEMSSQEDRGYYWSSTARSIDIAYVLPFSSSYVYPTTGIYYRVYGFSVRCLAADLKQYSITYNLNSGFGGPSPNPQTGETYAPFVELSSSTPTRSGYEFKGWCDKSTSDETCSGKTYQPSEQYTLSSNSNSVTLWAMWQENSSCPNTVTDCMVGYNPGKRFGDGKCWMTTDYGYPNIWSSGSCSGSGGSMPTETDFYYLISSNQAGNGACLFEQGWWPGNYWSSTNATGEYYSVLSVEFSRAYTAMAYSTSRNYLRCVSS